MVIEDQLDRLATAIEALTAAVSAHGGVMFQLTSDTVATAAAGAKAPRGRPAKGTPEPDLSAGQQTTAAVPAALSYHGEGGVRETILKLAEKKGHTVTVELLAKFGAKTGRDLKEAQYAEVMQAVHAALAK